MPNSIQSLANNQIDNKREYEKKNMILFVIHRHMLILTDLRSLINTKF